MIVIILPSGTPEGVTSSNLPDITKHNTTLFLKARDEIKDVSAVRRNDSNSTETWNTKRNTGTMLASTDDGDVGDLAELCNQYLQNREFVEVCNLCTKEDDRKDFPDVLKRYVTNIGKLVPTIPKDGWRPSDIKKAHKNIEEFLDLMDDEIFLQYSHFNKDGTFQSMKQVSFKGDDVINWDANTNRDITKLITRITPKVQYEGFQPRITRGEFLNIVAGATDIVLTRILCMVFLTYASVGNNITNFGKKRVNLEISKKVKETIEGLGIAKSVKTKIGLTIPRIVIAFLPEYLMFRISIFTVGQVQTKVTEKQLPMEFQDILFASVPAIWSKTKYEEYHKEMSSYLFDPKNDTELSDAKFLKDWNRWLKISKKGWEREPLKVKDRMELVLSTTGEISAKRAIVFINESITSVRSSEASSIDSNDASA